MSLEKPTPCSYPMRKRSHPRLFLPDNVLSPCIPDHFVKMGQALFFKPVCLSVKKGHWVCLILRLEDEIQSPHYSTTYISQVLVCALSCLHEKFPGGWYSLNREGLCFDGQTDLAPIPQPLLNHSPCLPAVKASLPCGCNSVFMGSSLP